MKEIELRNGMVTIVDDEDFDWVNSLSWKVVHGRHHSYVLLKTRASMTSLHRLVANAKKGDVVDHINGDTLDNRRSNLRICTHQQNMWNRVSHIGTSRFKGVTWDSRLKVWRARIRLNGGTSHIGRYKDEEDAARAYDEAARRIHGAFARTNFPAE